MKRRRQRPGCDTCAHLAVDPSGLRHCAASALRRPLPGMAPCPDWRCRPEATCRTCAHSAWIERHENRAHAGGWILMRCERRTDRAVFPDEPACGEWTAGN